MKIKEFLEDTIDCVIDDTNCSCNTTRVLYGIHKHAAARCSGCSKIINQDDWVISYEGWTSSCHVGCLYRLYGVNEAVTLFVANNYPLDQDKKKVAGTVTVRACKRDISIFQVVDPFWFLGEKGKNPDLKLCHKRILVDAGAANSSMKCPCAVSTTLYRILDCASFEEYRLVLGDDHIMRIFEKMPLDLFERFPREVQQSGLMTEKAVLMILKADSKEPVLGDLVRQFANFTWFERLPDDASAQLLGYLGVNAFMNILAAGRDSAKVQYAVGLDAQSLEVLWYGLNDIEREEPDALPG